MLEGLWFMISSRACCVKDGCRRSRGDGGGYRWFSTKFCRCEAMCPDLWVLDWELFRSMAGGAAVLSELLEVLEALPVFFAAGSVSIVQGQMDYELAWNSKSSSNSTAWAVWSCR